MKLRVKLLFVGVVLITICEIVFTSICLSAQSYYPTKITIASGSKKGNYFKAASAIKNVIENNKPSVQVTIITSQGSHENIELIYSREADFAICQNDILADYINYKRLYGDHYKRISVITTLFTEYVHVVASNKLNIESFLDLAGRKVGVGPKGSGSYTNARSILMVNNMWDNVELHISSSLEKLCDNLLVGSIDAIIYTTGVPSEFISNVLISEEASLIPIKSRSLTNIRRQFPEFVSSIIPSGVYDVSDDSAHSERNNLHLPPSDISTVGLNAVLICNSDLDKNFIEMISRAIFSNHKKINPTSEKTLIDEKNFSANIHPGVKVLAKETIRGKITIFLKYLPFLLLLLISIVAFFFLYNSKWRYFAYTKIFRILLILLIFWIIGTFLMHFIEKDVNENFITINSSFWSNAYYLFSGFEDKFPVTPTGKSISIFLIVGGIGIVALITGELASVLTKKKLRGNKRMEKRFKDHIVIINWNLRTETIIREIHDPVAEPDTQIIVLNKDTIDDKRFSAIEEFKKVDFVAGDLLNKDFMRIVNIHNAKSIIIMTDDDLDDPDGQSVLIAISIKLICLENQSFRCSKCKKEFVLSDVPGWVSGLSFNDHKITCPYCASKKTISVKTRRPRIVAEVLNHRKSGHLKASGVDETICSVDYGLGLLAQSAMYDKLSEVYQQLLTYSDDTNEIYMLGRKDISEKMWNKVFKGKSFEQVSKIFIKASAKSDNPAILIGFIHGDKVILNPKSMEFEGFADSSENFPILMAYSKPNLAKLMKNIKLDYSSK